MIYLRYALVVWVFILPEGLSSSGFPDPPACFIPCGENCQVDMHCTWAPGPNPQTTSNYTLHWKPSCEESCGGQHVFLGLSLNGSIERSNYFSHEVLHVWVQAENQNGSVESPVATFNTADIYKPPPPVLGTSQEPGISWNPSCEKLHLSLGSCDIQHRTEASQEWIQERSDHGSFTFQDPQLCSVYEVQVRCSCASGLKSDWSESFRKTITGAAPVGELDMWMDCGKSAQSSDCLLIWKELPPSQACGPVLGYEVRRTYLNSSVCAENVSLAENRSQFVCEEMKCHLNLSLKDVSSVSVLAYNPHGASLPSNLSVPVPGEVEDKKGLFLKMTEKKLTVWWNVSSVSSETLKEYVVTYKQPGSPLGQGLDWVRVSNSQTSASLNGHFKRYTPYQVSLLAVSHSNLSSGPSPVQHLSSAVGFSLQGTPPKVPSFKVQSIGAKEVTVSWEPIPLLQQNGTILYYQIGDNRQNVYNVSSSKTSKQLSVQQGQDYQVWIRAVTEAGPGEKVTVTLTTKTEYTWLVLILLPVLFLVLVLVSLALVRVCPGAKKACPLMHQCYEKVPDPRNSLIFRQKNQIHEPLDWFPLCESHPKISLLEVVEIQSWAFKSTQKNHTNAEEPTRPAHRDRSLEMDCSDEEDTVTGDSQRTNSKYRAEAYSKIIDSEEEEECWSSSKEELVESGYEKHFMPTAEEIQCDV